MKIEDTEALGQTAKPRSKPDIDDRPVRTARTIVHHYSSTQYCSTETVLLIFSFLQTNISSQMWPSEGGAGGLIAITTSLVIACCGRIASTDICTTAAAASRCLLALFTVPRHQLRLKPLIVFINVLLQVRQQPISIDIQSLITVVTCTTSSMLHNEHVTSKPAIL